MSEPDVIEIAEQLLNSLYDNGHLSVDQHTGIARGFERARELQKERDQYRNANRLAAQAFVDLEARLMHATERIGYLERLQQHLRDAARPAATALSNIAQLPSIDARIKETIQQTLAPLDAALAATKGDPKDG